MAILRAPLGIQKWHSLYCRCVTCSALAAGLPICFRVHPSLGLGVCNFDRIGCYLKFSASQLHVDFLYLFSWFGYFIYFVWLKTGNINRLYIPVFCITGYQTLHRKIFKHKIHSYCIGHQIERPRVPIHGDTCFHNATLW